MHDATPVLSICMTCRDGREGAGGVRGGTRLAQSVLTRVGDPSTKGVKLRGVQCMSQCKRPCVASLSAQGKFTYVFGELDPERDDHVDALLALAALYRYAPEGFLERGERPEPLRTNILGRLPPLDSASHLITPLGDASAA